MQVKAKLKNLRISPRKVRLAANLVKRMDAKDAKEQLRFAGKKAADPLLKLLNSALSNAKHNFNIEENNLFISSLDVDGGPSLKRWLPRAMGRATPLLKRTSSVTLILEEKVPGQTKVKKSTTKEEKPETQPIVEKEEKFAGEVPEEKPKAKTVFAPRPFGASSQAKKRFFSRQTFGNIKKMFRRKSI